MSDSRNESAGETEPLERRREFFFQAGMRAAFAFQDAARMLPSARDRSDVQPTIDTAVEAVNKTTNEKVLNFIFLFLLFFSALGPNDL